MAFSKPLSLILLTFFFTFVYAANFKVLNNCPFTVWAGAVPGGGARLDRGQSWSFNVNPGTRGGQIRKGSMPDWRLQRGLQCQGYRAPPNTLAEYALNQFQNKDFFDISLVDGFNMAVDFSPKSNQCRGIRCNADINGDCPTELRAPEGCNNPCTVFMNDQYCCNSGICAATDYSRFFKSRCPDAYSCNKDDQTSTFICPGGTNYTVVFCP